MIYAPHTLELTLDCSSEKFGKLRNAAYERAKGKHKMFSDGSGKNIDRAFADTGIKIEYHDTIYKHRIKFIVNPTRLLGGNDVKKLWKPNGDNISKLTKKLESHIADYFNSKYNLNDFRLTRIDFTVNIDVGNKDIVAAYIKVLHNIRKVKGFSPKDWKDYDGYDENASFDLEGNSNGVQFVAYDKAAAIKNNVVDSEYKRKEMKERLDKAKGVLRLEVKLTTQKAIRRYTNESDTVKRIIDLCNNSTEIFLDTFIRVVPFGDFHKKDNVVKIIEESVSNKHLKRKMLHLLELIPKKKSLYLAQKALADRNIEKIMKMFAELNVSPVTLSKRHDVKHLSNLYAFI